MKGRYAHVDAANQYARDVVGGKIPACQWVVLACERHLCDKRAARHAGFAYRFDAHAAERACRFMQIFPHTKGKWALQHKAFVLEPWQCFLWASVFGWRRKRSGVRRYRTVLLLVPRKNGKSDQAARVGLYMLAADGEFGAEVYSGATSEKQAWMVFGPARHMASRTPEFVDWYGVGVNASNLHRERDGSRFEPIIGRPGDGASPSCAIIDEYHEHATDDLFNTMQTGMGAREQPLALVITTAGDNLSGPCYALQQDAQKVLQGVIHNDELFALIYTIDPGDDWTSIESLRKANPNYGVSIGEEFLIARRSDAINNARKQATYQTKHLNVWVGSRQAYFNVERFRQCADKSLALDDFAGHACFVGLDLASKVDIAALEILIPIGDDDYVRFGRYYLPEATVERGDNEHYQGWMRDGRLIVTDGEIIDYARIKDDILALSSRLEVREVAYDPHQATMLVTALMDEGVPVVEVRPTVLSFSEPMKTLDGLIRARQIRHDDDPVMTWMVSNVVAREDAKDNVYPRKERSEAKIDGVVALLMALGRAMVHDDGGSLDDFLNDPIVSG